MSDYPPEQTLLVLSRVGFPPLSARGVKQTLTPIAAAGNLKRTVNAKLKNLAPRRFRKYQSEISCTDQNVPAFDDIFEGDELVVDCMEELSYPTATGTPIRPVVEGSERVVGDYTFYRPRLNMMVTGFQVDEDEWGGEVSWKLSLEEI